MLGRERVEVRCLDGTRGETSRAQDVVDQRNFGKIKREVRQRTEGVRGGDLGRCRLFGGRECHAELHRLQEFSHLVPNVLRTIVLQFDAFVVLGKLVHRDVRAVGLEHDPSSVARALREGACPSSNSFGDAFGTVEEIVRVSLGGFALARDGDGPMLEGNGTLHVGLGLGGGGGRPVSTHGVPKMSGRVWRRLGACGGGSVDGGRRV